GAKPERTAARHRSSPTAVAASVRPTKPVAPVKRTRTAEGPGCNGMASIIQECADRYSLKLKNTHLAVVLRETGEVRIQMAPRIDSCRKADGAELAEAKRPWVLRPSPRKRESAVSADHQVGIRAFDPGARPLFQPIVQLSAGGQSGFD